MKISFLGRYNKKVNGRIPLYVRIKGLGRPAEISLKKYVRPALWDSRSGRITGRGAEVDDLNDFLDSVRYDLGQAYRELYREGRELSAAAVKNRYLAIDLDEVMGLLAMFDYHMTRETGRLADSTLKNYKTTREYVRKYIKASFRANELPLDRLNFAFIDGFEVFLRRFPTPEGQRPLQNNGIMKHIERLQKVVNLAVKLDHISKDPFKMYQRHMEKPQQVYLTADELKAVAEVQHENEGHQLVRDLFLFGCYTGVAYVDLQALQPEDIVIGLDRMLWISNLRRKSGQPFKVPLLPVAHEIFLKYQDDPRSLNRKACFPEFSAQKINLYLKDIAAKAKIPKNLTYYAARHTFATTVTLSNGVPIESVSKMLGHSRLTTTQVYARVIDTKLSSDMMVLRQKLDTPDDADLKISRAKN